MSDALTREDLRDEFLMCRTVGHAWFESPERLPKPDVGWRFSNRCERCTAGRFDVIDDDTGAVIERRYEYPEGYEIGEMVTRSELRLEYARRLHYFTRKDRKKAV